MFDLYGCYFEYDGTTSDSYNLIFGNVSTDRMTTLSASTEISTVRSKSNYKNYIVNTSFDDQGVSFDAEIVTEDGSDISDSNINTIERWLFNQRAYKSLKYRTLVNGVMTSSTQYLKCIFLNPERIESGSGTVGYKFTIYTDSILVWEPTTTQTISFEGTGQSQSASSLHTITVDSDMIDYIYPKVTLTAGTETLTSPTTRDVTIINQTDSATRQTGFTNLTSGQQIVMDGSLKYIQQSSQPYFTDRNFIRLKTGTNVLQVLGNVQSITLEFNNRKHF